MDQATGNMLLAALILVLGKQIKAEKAARGTTTTSDCTDEAARLIMQKHDDVLRLLLQP